MAGSRRVDVALDVVASWRDQTSATIVHPGLRHVPILRELLLPLDTGGNLTSDAHLAALAIEHGAELCSSDVDFARFGGLQWRNPLA
ncbi:MAG: PIN domain-containing protein [Candidatus Sulfopaludibacter sp.]|nr:PIN domain-containing protein [Candidatus Sulfopaludibacter sp.]